MKFYNRDIDVHAYLNWEGHMNFINENPDTDLISEFDKNYMTVYSPYAERMGSYKNREYAAVGILDKHDMVQEAHLAFLTAIHNLDEDKIAETHERERGAMIWSYVNNSAKLNFARRLRELKDGVRIPEWDTFSASKAKSRDNLITTLFRNDFQEQAIFNNLEDEVTFDFFHHMVREEIVKQIARMADWKSTDQMKIIRGHFGIGYRKGHSLKVIARAMGKSHDSVRQMYVRAIKALRTPEILDVIIKAHVEYGVPMTQEMDKFFKKVRNTRHNTEKSLHIMNVGDLKQREIDAYKALGIDVLDSHYGYAEYSYRTHGEIASSEDTFASRDAALKSLRILEAEETIRVIFDDHDEFENHYDEESE